MATCQRTLATLEPERLEPVTAALAPDGVTLGYRLAGRGAPAALTCRFAAPTGPDRLRLAAVIRDDGTTLSSVRLALLQRALELGDDRDARPGAAAEPPLSPAGYLVQLLINGLVLGAVYALVAAGYAQVFSLLEIVNFAFGELAMLGAYLGLAALLVLGAAGPPSGPGALIAGLVAAAALSLPWGWAIARLVYRPLWRRNGTGAAARLLPLVSAVGLSILLQNLVLVTQGARNKWLPPLLEGSLALPLPDGGAVRIGALQATVVGIAALLGGALCLAARHSRFGRAQRACAQDRVAAALLGVDVEAVIARSFVIGAGLAGAAGLLALALYGQADPQMGVALGFKALSAAVLGGIGSLGGALAGGVLIGVGESLWAGYLDGAYRDVAIFGALILTLVLRPSGLFGDPGRTSS